MRMRRDAEAALEGLFGEPTEQAPQRVFGRGVPHETGLIGQDGGVGAPDEQVACVQAQGDGRPVEDTLYVVSGLNHGADVRVQHGAHAVLSLAESGSLAEHSLVVA